MQNVQSKVSKIPVEEKIFPNCEAWHSPLLLLVSPNGCILSLCLADMEHKESICIATKKESILKKYSCKIHFALLVHVC